MEVAKTVEGMIVLFVTIDTVGLGTLSMTFDKGTLNVLNKDTARLVNPVATGFESYLTSSNKFLQGRITDAHGNLTSGMTATFIMLSSESAHVKVLLTLAGDADTGFSVK